MTTKNEIINRFISYVKIDTQSDSSSDSTPSTAKQWNLANILVDQLREMGMQEVKIDENAYVRATLPSNMDQEVPVIGFVAHFDTTPDFSGTNVNPQIIEDYDGGDIVLNREKNIVLSPDYFQDLHQYKGNTIITTDGTTLLGADDKAGITEIMEAMKYLLEHPEVKHGKVRICFTPDEEIGRGAHKFNVEEFAAEWAYTMDGSQIGELEFENFNAAKAMVTVYGRSVHPGYAKDKMINSQYIAQDFINSLPRLETPEHTEGRQGFFHLSNMNGDVEKTELHYIIRDHDKDHFEARKKIMSDLALEICTQYEEDCVDVKIEDQYYNMREKIEPVIQIVEIAKQAMEELGIEPLLKPIRGGTDGAQLSFMGLPCPNIFAGGHNFHGKYEYVPVESMQKAVQVIVRIAEITAQGDYSRKESKKSKLWQ